MVTQILNRDSIQSFRGLSTDTKPTDCGNGSVFYEIDTKKGYCFDYENKTWILTSSGGGGDVSDVKINGTSVVTAGVANIPLATYTQAGVTRVGTGLTVSSLGDVGIQFATESTAKSGRSSTTTIPPSVQHASAFYGLAKAAGDTTQAISSNPIGTYTDDAKTAIRSMLGGVVSDVQINGTSVVTDGVADIPMATDAEVKAGTATDKALAPSNESAASFYGLAKAAGDTTQAASSNPVGTYTAEAQAAIKTMLGVSSGGGETWELINTIEPTEEVYEVSFTKDSNNQSFSLKKALIIASLPKYTGESELPSNNCFAKINNIYLGPNCPLAYNYFYPPSNAKDVSHFYLVEVKQGVIPYHEKMISMSNANGQALQCVKFYNMWGSADNRFMEAYRIDGNEPAPNAITQIGFVEGKTIGYEGCVFKLYGVRI